MSFNAKVKEKKNILLHLIIFAWKFFAPSNSETSVFQKSEHLIRSNGVHRMRRCISPQPYSAESELRKRETYGMLALTQCKSVHGTLRRGMKGQAAHRTQSVDKIYPTSESRWLWLPIAESDNLLGHGRICFDNALHHVHCCATSKWDGSIFDGEAVALDCICFNTFNLWSKWSEKKSRYFLKIMIYLWTLEKYADFWMYKLNKL